MGGMCYKSNKIAVTWYHLLKHRNIVLYFKKCPMLYSTVCHVKLLTFGVFTVIMLHHLHWISCNKVQFRDLAKPRHISAMIVMKITLKRQHIAILRCYYCNGTHHFEMTVTKKSATNCTLKQLVLALYISLSGLHFSSCVGRGFVHRWLFLIPWCEDIKFSQSENKNGIFSTLFIECMLCYVSKLSYMLRACQFPREEKS